MNKELAREEFLNQVRKLTTYWQSQPGTEEEKVNGIAFSILSLLDGCTVDYLVPIELIIDSTDYGRHDIAGELHDCYYD